MRSTESKEMATPETMPIEEIINITHVQQVHNARYFRLETEREKEKIAISQFNVAWTILANPHAIPVVEGIYKNLTPESRNISVSEVKNCKKLFPNGLHTDYTTLNDEQKEFLVAHGGAETLFYLENINYIYRTTTLEESKEILRSVLTANFAIRGALEKLGMNSRDASILGFAEQASREAKNPNVLLILGSLHVATIPELVRENPRLSYKGSIVTDEKPFPPQLLKAIKENDVFSKYIREGFISFEQLVELSQTEPRIIDKLSNHIVANNIFEKKISIQEIYSKLVSEKKSIFEIPPLCKKTNSNNNGSSSSNSTIYRYH